MKNEIIAKVEGINKGKNFCNATVVLEDQKRINLKLEKEDVLELAIGKIYAFNVEQIEKEEEIVLKCNSFDNIENVLKGEKLENVIKAFYEFAPIALTEIEAEIEKYILKIENKNINKIVKKIHDDNRKRFYIHPAATKFHHTYVGGLSHHTLTMLKIAESFLSVYPYLEKDLLFAGIVLHDMAKINEISGVNGEYTTEGQLIGHIVMETINIDKVAEELKIAETEEVLLLKHIILSHHGQLNYGSPKKPQTAEALLIWFIDTIDSKFAVLGTLLDETESGSWTQASNVLDKQRFYKGNLKK